MTNDVIEQVIFHLTTTVLNDYRKAALIPGLPD